MVYSLSLSLTNTHTQILHFFPQLFNDKPKHMMHATQDKVLTYCLTHRYDEDEHIHTFKYSQYKTQDHTHTHTKCATHMRQDH